MKLTGTTMNAAATLCTGFSFICLLTAGCAEAANSNWKLSTLSASGELRCAALSPEGNTVAVGTKEGVIEIWNITSNRLARKWTAHKAGIQSLAYDSTGAKLASEGRERTIAIWDVATSKEAWRANDPTGSDMLAEPLFCNSRLTFVDDDKCLAAYGWFWNATSGEQQERYGNRGPVVASSKFLASDAKRGYQVLKLENKESLLLNEEDALQCLALSPDNKHLAMGRSTFGVGAALISLEAPIDKRSLPDVRSWVFSIAFAGDSKQFVLSENRHGIKFFDTDSLALIDRIEFSGGNNRCLCFAPDASLLIGVGESNKIRIWRRAAPAKK